MKHFQITFLELAQQLSLVGSTLLLRFFRIHKVLWGSQLRGTLSAAFFVKCCLLAAALLPDTFAAWKRPLRDLEVDETASPRGRGAETPFRETPFPGGGAMQSRGPSECQLKVSGLEAGLPGFRALAQTPVGQPARAGLGGREEEAKHCWGGGRVQG